MVQHEPFIQPQLKLLPCKGFKEIECLLVLKHPLILHVFFQQNINEMDSFFVGLEVLCLHICFNLAQPSPHPFGFSLLPWERISQPCFYGHLGKTLTWNTIDGTQSFRDLGHELGHFMVLRCGFPLLHHECSEGVKEGQKLLGHFVHLWTSVFLCLGKLVHS